MTADRSSRDAEIERWRPVAVRIAVEHVAVGGRAGYELDDLIQIGVIGLIDGIDTYQPGRGMKLRTWLYCKARWAIADALRANNGVVTVNGKALDKGTPQPTYAALSEECMGGEDFTDEKDTEIDVRRALAALTPYQREVLTLRYFNGFGPGEIAAILGTTVMAVDGRRSKGLRKLRKLLTAYKHE